MFVIQRILERQNIWDRVTEYLKIRQICFQKCYRFKNEWICHKVTWSIMRHISLKTILQDIATKNLKKLHTVRALKLLQPQISLLKQKLIILRYTILQFLKKPMKDGTVMRDILEIVNFYTAKNCWLLLNVQVIEFFLSTIDQRYEFEKSSTKRKKTITKIQKLSPL